MIPTKKDNPNGLHQKYEVRKANGENVSPNAEYFVLRLDDEVKDKNHLEACRIAINAYADAIKPFIPELSNDLKTRYKTQNQAVEGETITVNIPQSYLRRLVKDAIIHGHQHGMFKIDEAADIILNKLTLPK